MMEALGEIKEEAKILRAAREKDAVPGEKINAFSWPMTSR
jgi:hypothetical protein